MRIPTPTGDEVDVRVWDMWLSIILLGVIPAGLVLLVLLTVSGALAFAWLILFIFVIEPSMRSWLCIEAHARVERKVNERSGD